VEQARLAGARLRHHCDDLPAPAHHQIESMMHLLKLALAPNEYRQSPPRRDLEAGLLRSDPGDFTDVDRFADSRGRHRP
jgi:hypothetical protein